MAVLVWPENLPQKMFRSGFEAPLADGRMRAESAEGPGRLRLRTSAAVRQVAGTIDMSAAQWARLERFWDEDARQGVMPFWFPNQTRHGFPLLAGPDGLPLLTAAGEPILICAWWLCQFGQRPPSPSPMAGGRMRVALSLVVLP